MTLRDEPELLVELAARDYLARHGVPLQPVMLVRDRAELHAAVESLGADLVLKIAAPWLVHKSDLGLVRVGVRAEDAGAVFDELARMARDHGPIDGVLVAPRLDGVEMIVGLRRDPSLGAFVLIGAGGTFAEVLDDVAIAPVPVDDASARRLVGDLRVAALLDGQRGRAPADITAFVDVIVAVSDLAERDAGLVELDLNPVMVGWKGAGAVAVDARCVRADAPPAASERRQRNLLPLFDPASVAVIGASTDPHKLGARIVRYLVDSGYGGRVVPVHPTATEIYGQPAAASAGEAGAVDLACVVVGVDAVEKAVADCAAAGIHHAIVHTSGFAEADADGVAAQRRLAETVRAMGMSVCGPNSLGIISPSRAIFTSFAGALESAHIQPGHVGFVSQSGAIASSLLSRSVDDNVGFSRWISSGNEVDLDIADYVEFMARDPETSVIALFIEEIRDGRAFRAAVREALAAGKPVLAFKSGRSDVGRRVTQSHTGALAGDDRLYEAFLREAGVVRVGSLRDLLDAARILAAVPLARGRRLGAVTMSGGASSVIADVAAECGLDLIDLDAPTAGELRRILPAAATVGNPLDVTAAAMVDPGLLIAAARQLVEAPAIDIVIVQLTTNADPVAARMAEALVELYRSSSKPLIISRLGSPSIAPRAMQIYRSASVPVLTWPEDATRIAGTLAAAAMARALVPQEVATTR